MKKIPVLFVRNFLSKHEFELTEKVEPGMEWVLNGEGIATVKIDGTATAIIDGVFYKRYDAKAGKKPPEGAIPCCDPDPVTGHWPHWVKVDSQSASDKWLCEAYKNADGDHLEDGTYEAIGLHFQGNPYQMGYDIIEKHGARVIEVERSFEGIKKYLSENYIEGIVFWKDGEPQCKIRRKDYGFPWKK